MKKNNWKPTGSLETLKKRAFFVSEIRAFFKARNVLEVETPILSAFVNTDVNIESYCSDKINEHSNQSYLRTSPEFPLKRLISAGYGDIFELGKVFRKGEVGSHHNSEFTMLEWYRVGYDFYQLMDEISELYNSINSAFKKPELQHHFITFDKCFEKFLGVCLNHATIFSLNKHCRENGYSGSELTFDQCLDYLFSVVIQPNLGKQSIQFVTHYPASQSALAEIDPNDPNKSLRFEFFIEGVEFGNGYQELTNSAELKQRFKNDVELRQNFSNQKFPMDHLLLEAMETGFPKCSGVAVGVDRWLAQLLEVDHIKYVISFSSDNS